MHFNASHLTFSYEFQVSASVFNTRQYILLAVAIIGHGLSGGMLFSSQPALHHLIQIAERSLILYIIYGLEIVVL